MLYARSGNALRLTAVDGFGAAAGVSPGMTLADARARCPGLVAVEGDEAADRHWLEQMAQDCIRHSPHVTLLAPDGIGLDISGTAHLFGGEQALLDLVMEELAAQGMELRGACGGTMQAAQALARYGNWPVADEYAAIRALPTAALGLDEEAALGLKRAGLTTVGAVAARPLASIAARFGMAAVTAIERLLGAEQAPITVLKPQEPLRFERRFAEPVTHQDAIANTLQALMREAAAALEERGEGGRQFRLELHRSDGAVQALDIATGGATRDPARVRRLFAERIGALADPLDPGFGYDSMVLEVPVAEPLAVAQSAFGKGAAADQGGGTTGLVEQLSTRLGAGAVCRLVAQDSHIPEQAQLALPAIEGPMPTRWTPPAPGEPPARPLFLFDPPQMVTVIAEVPDGPPHRFRWRRKLHEVRLYEGPERIACEWWRRKGGEQEGKGGLTRDYYRVEDVRGRRFWLFRHGLYSEKPDPRWYLHGLFA